MKFRARLNDGSLFAGEVYLSKEGKAYTMGLNGLKEDSEIKIERFCCLDFKGNELFEGDRVLYRGLELKVCFDKKGGVYFKGEQYCFTSWHIGAGNEIQKL